MNRHLETIDAAIANLHSRCQDPYPYSAADYDRDLQNLIELRSFVETAVDIQTAYEETGCIL